MSDTNVEIGERVYDKVLSGRSGFCQYQLGIDDDIWEEIMEELGQAIQDEVATIALNRITAVSEKLDVKTPRCKCPDGGTCHHDCMATCFRVECCSPLSGVYPDDKWPVSVELFPTPISIMEDQNNDSTS